MLWVTLAFGLRHFLFYFASKAPATQFFFGRWGELQSEPVLLLSDFLVVWVVFLAGQRVPEAGPRLRALWYRSRHVLLSAFALDLLLFSGIHALLLLNPDDMDHKPVWITLAATLIALLFIARSQLVRDIFADFPVVHPPQNPSVSQENPASLSTKQQGEALHARALNLFQTGKAGEALRVLREAMSLDPEQPLYPRNAGEMARRLGRHAEAVTLSRRATELAPNDAEAFYHHALALTDAQQLDDALANYCQALALNPKHLSAWNNTGVVLRQQGHNHAARVAFEKALVIDPEHIEARHNLEELCHADTDSVGHAVA